MSELSPKRRKAYDDAYANGCLDTYKYVHKLLGDESHEVIEDHVTEALQAASQEVIDRVLATFERPPVWGPNENGDMMLDMSLDGFQQDLRHALEGTKPSGRPPRA